MRIQHFFLLALLTLSIQSANSQNIKKGLIAHYLFNNDVMDNSKNDNHGMMKGGLQFDVDRFGNNCAALKFNGVDSYVEVPSSRSLESPTNELSVAVWFKLDAGATDLKWLTVVCKSNLPDEADNSPQYRMQATRVTLSVNTEFTENLNADVDLGKWYHYVTVYDGSSVTAYLNGFSFFTFPYSGVFTANRMPLDIGRDIPGVEEYFSGSFDDLRIYNRALSEREVAAIFNDDSERTRPKPCPPTIPPTTPAITTPTPSTPPTPTPPPTQVPAPVLAPPVVIITDPNTNPYQVGTDNHTLKATIDNVDNSRDITFLVNGQPNTNFAFDLQTREFISTINLAKGRTICEIVATNSVGKDSDSAILVYNPSRNPPVITVINPAGSPHQSSLGVQQITATITNISSEKDIDFKMNGMSQRGFTFDPGSQTFVTEVELEEGNNIFEIYATNPDGRDSKSGIIQYTTSSLPPIVTITEPVANPHPVSQPRQRIRAKIENISGKRDIQFRFNGTLNNSFTFDAATQSFESDQPLENGYNAFEISATNPDGRDSKSGSIVYRPTNGIPPPDPGMVTLKDDIQVSSPSIKLICYDHKDIDGDIVSILFNGEVLVDRKTLQAKGNGEIVLDLPPLEPNKPYILVSKAWNLGSIPPNTLTMEIHAGGKLFSTVVLESEIGKSEALRITYLTSN